MKLNIKILFSSLIITAMLFSMGGCQDILDTSSNRIAFEKDNQLKNTNDLFYTISGIMAEVQKIGDKYVLFGELRGDLMTVSENASVSLKEINQFQTTAQNTYRDQHDYYNVINNCNYAIQKIDTSVVLQNEKVMLPGYTVIKTVRAWTYFQLAQIYGKVTYFDKPILNLEASLATYPALDMDALVAQLITDLEPYAQVPAPASSISPNNFVPVQIMLGDLYLYQNNYEKAAQMYYNYMNTHSSVITADYASRWTNTTFEEAYTNHRDSYLNETISSIQFNTDPREFHSGLVGLCYNDKAALLPANNYMDFMSLSPYFYADKIGNNITATSEGDLRGNISITKKKIQYGDAYSFENTGNSITTGLIYKYFYRANESTTGSDPNNKLISGKLVYLTQIPVFRIPHLYLRYAEAVNRIGKPSLAFAVLKYGLTSSNIANPAMVNPTEVANSEPYVNFQNTVFDQNVPTAARGRGLGISKDTKVFVIPDYTRYVNGVDGTGKTIKVPTTDAADMAAARQDSISWVELRILDELAAETPFEGNRFFDLLRVSRRRSNHPEFMAEKVAAKYDNPEAMKARLMDINAWFVK
ncbi:MAG: RagB/SusD family nutrient uptake outer membrane protein [Paludibacter sp.]|nr:RagB/SusD family nutrient uptake outer membrane protein [Paludibacter sp.]